MNDVTLFVKIKKNMKTKTFFQQMFIPNIFMTFIATVCYFLSERKRRQEKMCLHIRKTGIIVMK